MKHLLFFALVSLSFYLPAPLLVVDMNGKRPKQAIHQFSPDQYINRCFPIYASDLNELMKAIEKVAKLIDSRPACNRLDTVVANHTLVIVRTDCKDQRQTTVRLVTRIEEPKFLCDFEMVRGEDDARKAQIKLLDFVSYLSQ